MTSQISSSQPQSTPFLGLLSNFHEDWIYDDGHSFECSSPSNFQNLSKHRKFVMKKNYLLLKSLFLVDFLDLNLKFGTPHSHSFEFKISFLLVKVADSRFFKNMPVE